MTLPRNRAQMIRDGVVHVHRLGRLQKLGCDAKPAAAAPAAAERNFASSSAFGE